MQSRRQQTKRGDHWQIDIVSYRHQLRRRVLIQLRDRGFVARIEFHDLRFLVNDLRLVIAHPVDLVRDLLEICLPNDDANQFFAAELDLPAGIIDPGTAIVPSRAADTKTDRMTVER